MSGASGVRTLEVPLTKGYVAIIDVCDAWVLQHKWRAQVTKNGHVYAVRNGRSVKGRQPRLHLHREILGLTARSVEGDHVNGDTLNDTRANLRAVTRSENLRNRSGPAENSVSGYLGVHWHKTSGKWAARIMAQGKQRELGYFNTPEEANTARLAAERDLWGIQPRRAWAHTGGISGLNESV